MSVCRQEQARCKDLLLVLVNYGENLGPFLGGLLAVRSGDFVGAFRGLVAFGSPSLLVLEVFLKETARKVVGNGDQYLNAYGLGPGGTYSYYDSAITWERRIHIEKKTDANQGTTCPIEPPDHATLWKRTLKKINVWGPARTIFYRDTTLIFGWPHPPTQTTTAYRLRILQYIGIRIVSMSSRSGSRIFQAALVLFSKPTPIRGRWIGITRSQLKILNTRWITW